MTHQIDMFMALWCNSFMLLRLLKWPHVDGIPLLCWLESDL